MAVRPISTNLFHLMHKVCSSTVNAREVGSIPTGGANNELVAEWLYATGCNPVYGGSIPS